MDKAFSKAWAISLIEPESFDTLTDFYITASSFRPTVKTSSINIDGMDGELDTTEINGGIHYNNRAVKVWLVTKATATQADVDDFVNTYVGKVVWLRNTTDGYQYKGRLTLVADSGGGTPRMLTMEMNADPYKYATAETVYSGFAGGTASKTELDFLTMTKESGTLQAISSVFSDPDTIIFSGDAGDYATYSVDVERGADYSALIATIGATVEIQDSDGNNYATSGFEPTESSIIVKITKNNSAIAAKVKCVLVKTPYLAVTNDGVDVLGYYQNGNPTGNVALLLNGKQINLDYTGNSQAYSPELVIKHGTNKYAFIETGDDGSARIFIGWRAANV